MDTKQASKLMSNGTFINGIMEFVDKLEKRNSCSTLKPTKSFYKEVKDKPWKKLKAKQKINLKMKKTKKGIKGV